MNHAVSFKKSKIFGLCGLLYPENFSESSHFFTASEKGTVSTSGMSEASNIRIRPLFRAVTRTATCSTGRLAPAPTGGSSHPSWTRPCSWSPPGTRYTNKRQDWRMGRSPRTPILQRKLLKYKRTTINNVQGRISMTWYTAEKRTFRAGLSDSFRDNARMS